MREEVEIFSPYELYEYFSGLSHAIARVDPHRRPRRSGTEKNYLMSIVPTIGVTRFFGSAPTPPGRGYNK